MLVSVNQSTIHKSSNGVRWIGSFFVLGGKGWTFSFPPKPSLAGGLVSTHLKNMAQVNLDHLHPQIRGENARRIFDETTT